MVSRLFQMDNLFWFECKSRAHVRPSNIEKESASYGDTDQALNNAAKENVNEIPQNLSSDNGHSQPPSPLPPLEPTCSSEDERHCK